MMGEGEGDGGLLEALCPDLLSRMSPRPWALSRSLKRVTSSFSSRTSLALGSSLITALHLICLARSAYLWACESVWGEVKHEEEDGEWKKKRQRRGNKQKIKRND